MPAQVGGTSGGISPVRPAADRASAPTAMDPSTATVSRMAAQLGERLVEAEINPIFVLPQWQGVLAADGVVVLAQESNRAGFIELSTPRRLACWSPVWG